MFSSQPKLEIPRPLTELLRLQDELYDTTKTTSYLATARRLILSSYRTKFEIRPLIGVLRLQDELYDITGTMSIDEELTDMLDRPSFQQRRRETSQIDDVPPAPRSAAEASEQAAPPRAAPAPQVRAL